MWDSCILMWFIDGRLVLLILSTDIDDLKGAGEPKVACGMYDALTLEFDKTKKSEGEFQHCGIAHCQNEDGSVTMTQDHYIKDLKPIPLSMETSKRVGDRGRYVACSILRFTGRTQPIQHSKHSPRCHEEETISTMSCALLNKATNCHEN